MSTIDTLLDNQQRWFIQSDNLHRKAKDRMSLAMKMAKERDREKALKSHKGSWCPFSKVFCQEDCGCKNCEVYRRVKKC